MPRKRARPVREGVVGKGANTATSPATYFTARPVRRAGRGDEPAERQESRPGPTPPLPRGVLGPSPEYLPHGRTQAGDRHLKFHESRDNLSGHARSRTRSGRIGTGFYRRGIPGESARMGGV